MDRLRGRMAAYSWEQGQDPAWWKNLLGRTGADELETAIAAALERSRDDDLERVFQFIRDLVNPFPDVPCKDDFLARFPESAVIRELEALAADPEYDVRTGAVFTLGKTFARGSVPNLLALFKRIKDSDPLFTAGLAHELIWLAPADLKLQEFLKSQMAASPGPFTRWAVLEVIGPRGGGPDSAAWAIDYELSSRLAQDGFALVREEARSIQALLELRKGARQKGGASIERKRTPAVQSPRVTFQQFRLAFEGQMRREKRANYTIENLKKFLKDEFGRE